jgi:recombination protein RecA
LSRSRAPSSAVHTAVHQRTYVWNYNHVMSLQQGPVAGVTHPLRKLRSAGMTPVSRDEATPRQRDPALEVNRRQAAREERGPTMERDKALEAALSQIEKQFGKGSVMRMGEHTGMGIEVISTGAMALDLALGIGGLPRGRIIELFGPESSGKSTLALHVVAEAQRNGGICVYIDAEHALDPVYAKAIGVDVDELLISQPDTGEQALEIADMLIRSGAMDVIVIDSVAALVPRAELEGDMGDTHVGLQARLMSQALRKLTGTLSKSSTIALFINQLREKVGVIYGSPEITPGGRALKFYSSVRLDIRRLESIKDGAEIIGNRTRVKVVKNKCAPPFRMAEFDIVYGRGISREGSVLDVAVDLGIAKKSGAWYTYEGEQLGQGRENAKQFLRESPELMVELHQRIRSLVAEKAALAVETPIGAGGLLDDDDEPISLD